MPNLTNVIEKTIAEVTRGKDVLRVLFTTATTAEGKDVSWHSLRVFWQDQTGDWKPSKQGITIRRGELQAVARALVQASGGVGSQTIPETRPEPSTVEEFGF